MPIEIECKMCGRKVLVPDRRRKLCDTCRTARKKMFDRDAVKKFRDAARERRKAMERQNLDLIEENRLLREQIAILKGGVK